MEIIKCGTKVVPKLQNIEAMITAALIRFDKLQYEISYFYNGEYRCLWMHEEELEIKTNDKIAVGFK